MLCRVRPFNNRFLLCRQKPSMFDVSREMGSSVALYSRKVLIQTKATDILPKWLRFLRGLRLILLLHDKRLGRFS